MIGHDPDTGEKCLVVPVGNKGRVKFVPFPAETVTRYAAITDWLNFSFPMKEGEDVGPRLQRLFDVIGQELAPAQPRLIGKHNYERSYKLGDTKALFCVGGNAGTALVSLPGEVCALVNDWPAVVELGRDEWQGRITRWDGAVDDYFGTHGIDEAVALYKAGLFGAGGRQPKLGQHGNWISPDGRGRSLVIGERENGKRLIVYEKGMQLGTPWHPWVRWELSYGNKGRVVPWDVLLDPGGFVVGAYPKALSWIQEEMSRVRTLQKQAQISYDVAIGHARNQAGRVLNLMAQVEGSLTKAAEKLVRDGIPRRVQHPAVKNPEGWVE